MTDPSLTVRVSVLSSKVTVNLEGEIDVFTVQELLRDVPTIVAAQPDVVEFHVPLLKFMDSSGAGGIFHYASTAVGHWPLVLNLEPGPKR